MKKTQLFVYLMSLLFVMAQAQTAKENNFLMPTTAFNSLRVSTNREKAAVSINKIEVSKTINVSTAGTLNNLLTSSEKSTITNLTITGNLDARDFKMIRDSLSLLEILDMNAVNIQIYSGTAGPYTNQSYSYPANEIPAYAFCKMDIANPNTTLKSIVFPITATSIGEFTFALCTGFTSIHLPATINTIKDMAFVGFNGSFTVDSNNLNYSDLDGILMNKTQQLVIQCPVSKSGSYVIPVSVKTIGNYAFYGCNLLGSITIPISVTSIGSYAFFYCTGLTSVTVNTRPEKISLGSSCFYNVNTSSCALNVPFGTKTLFGYASQWSNFTNVVENEHGFMLNMSSMMLSSKISTGKLAIITNDAWTVNSDQTWITLNKTSGTGTDTIQFTSYENPTTENRIATLTFSVQGFDSQTVTITQSGLPKTVNTTAGGLSAAMTGSELSSIINLKITGTINARDFKTMRDNMPKLAFLDLSEVTIAAYSGSLGTSSGSVSYPANTIPDYAFNNGISSQNFTLSSIQLPTAITSIGVNAFYSCEALNSIVIPNSVTNIGAYAFGSCNTLGSVTLSNTLTSIGSGAFTGGVFSTITLPGSVTTIGSQSFAYCRNLTNILIPNSITSISSSTFQDCSSLATVNLGNSLISIGSSAFSGCTKLQNITIPNSVTLVDDYAFAYCNNLDSVSIGNSVATIGSSCFQNCSKLSKAAIPNSVTKIESYGFVSCTGLATISLGSGIKTIESYAFSNCTGLNSITVNSDIPIDLSSSYGVFTSVKTATCVLNVPLGTKNAYAAANQWKDFSNIIENTQGFALEINTVKLAYTDGSNATVKVTSNNPWSVSSDQSWLKASPATGTGNNWITLTADVNPALLTRTANVTVSAPGVNSKTITVVQAASPKIVTITAGGLATALTTSELSTLSSLTISGTIDSRDFKTMRDNMPQLAYVDISAVTIAAYNGSLGIIYYNYANTVPDYAFCSQYNYTGKASLTSIILPSSATNIGSSSFQSCIGLIGITIPNSITTVGYSAFSGCSGLKDLVLSTGMTKIQSSTFQNCTSLKSFTIPNSVTTIEYSAFQSCSSLDSITIPNSVVTIGTSAFASCSKLVKVTFPNALTLIDGGIFSNCISLQSITIPNSVATISSAFSNCSNLTTVNFGTGVKSIYSGTFESCTSLTKVAIPSSVTFLGDNVFRNCTALTDVSIPNSVTSFGSEFFNGCSALKEITLPNSINKLNSRTFYNCTALTKVTIGNSVKTIDYSAFYNCNALTSITLPNSVNTLGSSTFELCSKLTDILLGDSLITIGGSTFNGCTALKNITLPSTLTKIDYSAFNGCAGLTDIIIPNSVTTIGTYAFANCSELTDITLPNSLKTIESYTFSKCSKLANVSIGNSVTSIGDMAFESCSSLTSIALPASLKTIGSSSFYNCTALSGVTVPNSVVSIGTWAFQSCTGLTSATLSNSLKLIDSSVFYNCSGLTAIITPNSVTSIGSNAFWGCSRLTSVTLGNNVTTINGSAFNGCTKLTSLYIPGSVISIGYSAFESCTGLKSITVNALVPVDITNKTNVFYNVDKINCTLYVPYQTKTLYSSANQWKDFVNIVENPYGLILNIDSLNLLVAAGSNDSIHVTSNTSWTASSDQLWLSVNPGSGSGNGTIKIVADANPIFTTRKAIVTVLTSGIEPQTVIVTQDAATKTVAVSAGGLNSVLTHEEHTVLNRLTISGTIDASDFKFMRDSIPNLTYLDISQTTIAAYTGANGTGGTYSISYPAATIPQYAFYNTYSSNHSMPLKSIKLPNSITSIGNGAFEYCYKLDSVAIPNSVTTIGDFAFDSCKGMKSLTISNSLTVIGRVFGNCNSLTSVIIPNTVTSLAYGAFSGCSGLKNATLSNSLTTIGGSAFNYCIGLTSISIPNTVTLIDSYAFQSCSGLTNLVIGTKVNTIGMSAFSGCTGLTELTLPNSVITIGDYTFQGCNSLSTLTIPVNVSSIGSYAFSCSGLKSILSARETPITLSSYGVFSSVNKSTCTLYVPSGSKSLYQAATQWKDFSNISEDFEFMLSNDTIRIQSGGRLTIDIPTTKAFTLVSDQFWLKASTVVGSTTSQIVLEGDINPNLSLRTATVKLNITNGPSQSLTIIQSGTPKSVTLTAGGLRTKFTADELKTVSNLIVTGTIDARDFRFMRDSLPQLADIDLKNTSITAYSGSEGTNPSISAYSANEIPINAFYKTYSGVGKNTLASIILPDNTITIAQSAFAYARGIRSIVIPDQVTVIGMTAFARCEGLKNVTIGNSVTTIGLEAFYICTKLSEISIPNSVTTISNEAFSNCIALKSIIFSNNLRIIGADAFVACRSLTNVEIPNSVTTIETGAFRYCYKLARVVLPATLTELKYDAFYYCPLLKEIKLPETLKIIGPEAFAYCTGLSTISIPASVNYIGYNVFSNCTSLSSIYAYPISPVDLSSTSLSSNVFNNVNTSTCTLFVPTNSKALYQSAIQWKNFVNIIEMTTAVPVLTETTISIYPNPVKESFRIEGLDEKADLSLMDLSGKVVFSKQISDNETISAKELPQGTYIARIVSSNGIVERKLVKK